MNSGQWAVAVWGILTIIVVVGITAVSVKLESNKRKRNKK